MRLLLMIVWLWSCFLYCWLCLSTQQIIKAITVRCSMQCNANTLTIFIWLMLSIILLSGWISKYFLNVNWTPFHSILFYCMQRIREEKRIGWERVTNSNQLEPIKIWLFLYVHHTRWAKRYDVDVWNVLCRMRGVVVCFMPLMFRRTIIFNQHTTTRAQLLSLFGSWSPIDSWLCAVTPLAISSIKRSRERERENGYIPNNWITE